MVTCPMMKRTNAHMIEEMDRSADLAVARQLRIPREPGRECWRHRRASQHRQGSQDEHNTRNKTAVVARCSGRSHSAPAANEKWRSGRTRPRRRARSARRSGPGASIARCAQQQHHEDQAIAHPEQHAEKVPMPRHADGMPVAGQANPRREIAGVFFGRPDAVFGHLDRCEPEPLGAGRAMDVPVQPRMIRENLQAAANEQDQEQEVDVVGDAQPGRKAIMARWPCQNLTAGPDDTCGRPTVPH